MSVLSLSRGMSKRKSGRKHCFSLQSIVSFLRIWALRIVYTLFFAMAVYLVIGLCTIMIPSVMGYIIGSFGYTVSTGAEFLLAGLSGLFFTAWVFFGSMLVLRGVWRKYVHAVKNTIPVAVVTVSEVPDGTAVCADDADIV